MILLKYFSHNTIIPFILSSLFIIIYSYACNLYISIHWYCNFDNKDVKLGARNKRVKIITFI